MSEDIICGLLDYLLLCTERLVNRHASMPAPELSLKHYSVRLT